ncbi:class I SAM-dependent methyltransferase [Prochlorococcus sp. MIT 1341]|uniref:class I SAM-dependent methyltransferase n=1 Tax=Prochlorococcus sp. MIT 1341 TaxID=3096221 RepID=UPI002A76302F|nr:SAM-dependent methyltransferase [Prochlorococcus sp. MIT 1341]
MSHALNDPEHGAYGSSKLRIGKQGDFVTSPSLGSEFAKLLTIQIVDWFKQIEEHLGENERITLVEIGPGEGTLLADMISELRLIYPSILLRLEVVLIEYNISMISNQKEKLASVIDIPIHWRTFQEIYQNPITGILIAHEMLDALPVERFIWSNGSLWRQGVCLHNDNNQISLALTKLPIPPTLSAQLIDAKKFFGITIPPENVPEGWCSEWHCELENWFSMAFQSIKQGLLLVVDYCLEAKHYYSPERTSGTLLAYKKQTANEDFLVDPGFCDLTAHLCIETLLGFAQRSGWDFLGHVKQGEALLALGLADKLYSLQKFSNKDLKIALSKREELLRLVCPSGLGSFYWFAFQKSLYNQTSDIRSGVRTLFLEEPIA